MSKELWRNGIDQLIPYVPGKPIEEVKREFGIEKITRLASNENSFGPSPKAVQAMQEAVVDSWLYPDPTGIGVRERLASLHGISPDQFVLGNGADHLITLLGSAYINEGDEVIYCAPTFGSFRTSTVIMGGVPVELPLTDDFTYDLDAMLDAITDKTKLLYVCNPNNPTGTILKEGALEEFLKQVPSHVLVVLDEAYAQFISDENYTKGIDLIKKGYPIITLRTFSKLYGLAGTRIGYVMGNEDVLGAMKTVRPTFEVNRVALAGAKATLDDLTYSEETLKTIIGEIRRLTDVYSNLGFNVIDSHANFIFMDLKQDAGHLTEELLKKGLIIRPCTPWGLETYARISIGTPEENDLLVNEIKQLIS